MILGEVRVGIDCTLKNCKQLSIDLWECESICASCESELRLICLHFSDNYSISIDLVVNRLICFTGQSYQNTNIFQSPAFKPASSRSLIPFDKCSQVLCSQVLSCIGHLFSWIPLSTMITSHLLNTVFSFAAFGCESTRGTASG